MDEGLRALSEPYGDHHEDFMPKKRHVGRCRICGETAVLTKEHIPPAAAFNRGRAKLHTVDEWLKGQDRDELVGGLLTQDGVWGFTLCKPCNDLTGARYGGEYKRWANTVFKMLAGTDVPELDAERETRKAAFELLGGRKPRPGAFVRQVLAMMCSLSAGFDLAGRYPQIRRMILDGKSGALPAGMSIGLTISLSARGRFSGPQMIMNTAARSWRWVMEIAHAPLASVLVLASNARPPHFYDISHYTWLGPDDPTPVKGRIEIGFSHSPRITDYRSKAGIDADADGESLFVPIGSSAPRSA